MSRLRRKIVKNPLSIRFVIPTPEAFPSGGNLYNSNLVHALKKKGIDIQIIDFMEFSGRNEWDSTTLYFIDTLYMNQLMSYPYELNNCFLIVHHLESLFIKNGCRNDVFEQKERPTLERMIGFLTTGEFSQNYLLKNGLTNKKYLKVAPALCHDPDPHKPNTEVIEGLFVANLIERKGILPFLQSLQKSGITPVNCHIRIAGASDLEPDYAGRCLELIRSDPKLSDLITYEGACSQDRIQELYQQSNLFISTAFMETFGMALQEAVAHRLYILAIDGGNATFHIKEGKNGQAFTSVEQLVSRLEQLANSTEDFEQVVKVAWTFRNSESYDWDQAAQTLISRLK